MSLTSRAKEIAKVTTNKSLITVNLTTKLTQIVNYADWRRSLCKAETLVDSELQSALSSDSSTLATFRHLHDEVVKSKGTLPSRSARLSRVQTELQAAYTAASQKQQFQDLEISEDDNEFATPSRSGTKNYRALFDNEIGQEKKPGTFTITGLQQ